MCPAAAGRGAAGRIHGRESGRGSRHKVGSNGRNHRSSRHGDGGSAGLKVLQTEPNLGHLKCHKPVCGDCEESGGSLQTVTSDQNGSVLF